MFNKDTLHMTSFQNTIQNKKTFNSKGKQKLLELWLTVDLSDLFSRHNFT